MGRIKRLGVFGHFVAFGRDMNGTAVKGKFVTGEGHYESHLEAVVFDKNGRRREVHEYLGNRKDDSKLGGRVYNYLQKYWYKLLYQRKTVYDLGSGLTTNVAALAIANEAFLAGPSGAPINTLKICNFHATGTGATAAAATDIKLQTGDAVTPLAGTQSLISAANVQKLQTVATLAGYGIEAVTEWGLHSSATLSSTTGSPFTGTSAASWTDTGSVQVASSATVQGLQQSIVVAGTTTVWGLNTSNTTHIAQIPAWYTVAGGLAGSTPGATEAFTIRPILLDHKVFTAINTVAGDTIQFTYQMTIASGN